MIAGIWRYQGRRLHPERRAGYRRLVLGFVTFGNVPWLVMGAASLAGASVMRTRPWTIAFDSTIAALIAICTWWLFARDGAQKLVDHPGLIHPRGLSARGIKLGWLLSAAGAVAAIVVSLEWVYR